MLVGKTVGKMQHALIIGDWGSAGVLKWTASALH
jgi:hypothetical protein